MPLITCRSPRRLLTAVVVTAVLGVFGVLDLLGVLAVAKDLQDVSRDTSARKGSGPGRESRVVMRTTPLRSVGASPFHAKPVVSLLSIAPTGTPRATDPPHRDGTATAQFPVEQASAHSDVRESHAGPTEDSNVLRA